MRVKFGVIVAHYFLGKAKNEGKHYQELRDWGYNLKLKDPSPITTDEEDCPYCHKVIAPELEKYKADCDSFLTLTLMSELHMFDKAVIITSDGDYDKLIKMLLRQDKLRIVFAPCKKGCSWLLRSAARGRIAFIDDYKDELKK